MTVTYAVVGIVVAVVLWIALAYNQLVRVRQHVRESWSDIDTELKRRYDLVPNLVETVKGYAAHERATLEAVIAAREKARNSTGSPASQAADEKALVASMQKLLAVVQEAAENLGIAVAGLLNVMNPSLVVIGGEEGSVPGQPSPPTVHFVD